MCVCLCVCMWSCVFMGKCSCTCLQVSVESRDQHQLSSTALHFMIQGLSPILEWTATKLWRFLSLLPPQHMSPCPDFTSLWRSKLRSSASTLLTEPFPQLKFDNILNVTNTTISYIHLCVYMYIHVHVYVSTHIHNEEKRESTG